MPHNCYSLHNFVDHKIVDQSNLIDKSFDSHQEYTIVTSFRHPPEAKKEQLRLLFFVCLAGGVLLTSQIEGRGEHFGPFLRLASHF